MHHFCRCSHAISAIALTPNLLLPPFTDARSKVSILHDARPIDSMPLHP